MGDDRKIQKNGQREDVRAKREGAKWEEKSSQKAAVREKTDK